MNENREYANLKRMIKEAGLLEKRPVKYYGRRTLAILALLGASIAIMAMAEALYIHLLNAALLAFIFVQLCFLGHDLGHRQVFKRTRHNDIGGLLVSALVGINRSWWVEKHNRHHNNPNHIDLDPDVDLPVIAFTAESARAKPRAAQIIIRRQAWLFYPLVCLEGIVLKASGISHLISAGNTTVGNTTRPRLRFPVAERIAMAVHLLAYLVAAFTLMSPVDAALFIIVNQALMGLYIGSTFAPNHKGMEMVDARSPTDFLSRQVLTSRNVRPGAVNDYLYGGLNYQIEHHLFPAMPRNCLEKARHIVEPYCRQLGISYHETGIAQSQREILQHLHRVSRAVGQPPQPSRMAA